MAGVVHIPWYATVFRGDRFEKALGLIAPLALRYGATSYSVHRSRDDRYKFLQMSTFESKADWERYWYGEDFGAWRADFGTWYQVPVLYVWHDVVFEDGISGHANANGNGEHAVGASAESV
jgi:quinol monooxygenase YgiN